MGKYLNSMAPFEMWKQMVGTRFFVDKTLLLEEVLHTVETDGQRFLCITRPRRFGKSVMANMVGAFLGKASDSENVFRELEIAENAKYKKDLNQHNVIFIDFSRAPRDCSSYFGFTEEEVNQLFGVYLNTTKTPKITKEDLRIWYDGYHTASGERLYNPRSVVCALSNNQLANYWTSSGPYDEIFFYVRNDIEDIRDDLVLMIAGGGIEAEIQNYAAVSMELNTKDEIYSAMVIYGLLTYADGAVYIPNKELMDKFRELLMNKESMGYVKIQQKGTLHVEKIL